MKRKHLYFSIIAASLLLASVTTPVKDFLTLLSAKADNDAYFLPEYVNMPLFVRVEYQDVRSGEDVATVPYKRHYTVGVSAGANGAGSSFQTKTDYAHCCERVQCQEKKCDHNQTREDEQGLAACQQHYTNPSLNLLL